MPRIGKSTLLQRVIRDLPQKTGFVTHEVLEDGKRVGFEVEAQSGRRADLANIRFTTPHQVARYFVDTTPMEELLPSIITFGKDDVLYLDEIGEMQLLSPKFRKLALRYLNAENLCIATLPSLFVDDFIEQIKMRPDVLLFDVTEENREGMSHFLPQLLHKIRKAQAYVKTPERFTRQGDRITLDSMHGVRTLTRDGQEWLCDCDFFVKHHVCSHALAVEDMF